MKKRVLSLCLLIAILCGMIACISIVSAAPTSQSPTLDLENDVKWLGRTHVIGDRHYFTWSNSGFEFNFNGTAAYATMHFTNNYTSSVQKHDTAYLWVYVDGEKTSVINLKEATQEVTLAKNLSKGNHTIKVVKRVNGRSNQAAVSAIWLNDGAYVTPPNVESSRKIQFLGDSITVGYASINDVVKESAWSVHSEDSTVTYAALAADYFAADNHTIAVSGRGVIWNTGGGKDTANNAPLMYNYNDWTLKQQWDHSLYQPDVVVINLGTNDNDSCKTEQDKETFRAAVKSLIQQVRGINPDAHIIWAFGAMGDSNGLRSYIESAISELNAAGDEKIYYLHLPEGKESLGHPVASAHADLAELLIAKITRVTGWTKHTTHNYAKTNHSVSDCKTPGLDKYTCDGCGDVYTEELPLSDEHKTEEELTVLTPANCEESGWGYYACLICEQQVGDLVEIPSAGARHIASATITVQTPATCTKNGVGSRLCTICNSVVVSNVKIPATGQHVAKSKWKVTKAATCLKKGVEELQCKHCNTAMESRYIPKLKGKDSTEIFTDISRSDWFCKNGAIDYVYNSKFFVGVSDTAFGPNAPMTRGMMVTVLGRLHGVDTSKYSNKTHFTDVGDQYYTKYINWAFKAGIVSGTSATTFEPDANVTREQISKMILEYGYYADVDFRVISTAIDFTDQNSISSWARNYVADCQVCGIVSGISNGDGTYRFEPKKQATRAEVATIILNFAKLYL